jgi:hemerythrin-like domain-containing protein
LIQSNPFGPGCRYGEPARFNRATDMSKGQILAPLLESHERVIAACDALETIADALPDRIAPGQCERAIRETTTAVRQMHACENDLLMPLLSNAQRPELRKIAADLEQAHQVDSESLIEVDEVLTAFALGQPILSPDATGYMLRAFFEGLRRHVGRERDLLALMADWPQPRRSLH